MNLKLLNIGTEDERRWKIIDTLRKADAEYLPQLHARLESNETLENKRHIIRALGNIGSREYIPVLMRFLKS